MTANLAMVICEAFHHAGVEKVYGLPGTQNVAFFDALHDSALEFVSSTSELSAAFMALGSFRASGKPALLTTIPGPGFTYSITGMMEAREDSCAIVYLLTLPSHSGEKSHFLHDIEHEGIGAFMSKAIFVLSDVAQAESLVRQAVSVSLEGEPGPVILGVPASLWDEPVKARENREQIAKEVLFQESDVEVVAQALMQSERPLFYLGMGASEAHQTLRGLVDLCRIPSFSTLSGRGIISEDDPFAIPVDFSFGNPKAFQRLLRLSDLVVSVGCKFTHNGTGGYSLMLRGKSLIRVNSCADHLSTNYSAKTIVLARAERFLPELRQKLSDYRSQWSSEELEAVRAELKKEVETRARLFPTILRGSVEEFFMGLRRALPRDSVLVLDSGLHQVMARQYYPVYEPSTLLAPSDFQSMGYSLPVAIGVASTRRNVPVVCLIGDGSFNINGLELLSAIKERVNLLVLVFRDGHYGQIRMQQIARSGATFGVELNTPRYRDLAAALDVKYFKLHMPISECIRQALQVEGVKLMEIPLDDPPDLSRVSFLASAKAKARNLLGPVGLTRVKKLFGK